MNNESFDIDLLYKSSFYSKLIICGRNKYTMNSFDKLKKLISLGGSGEIARRYMVMNSFDGALTVLGIIIGSWFVGISDSRILLVAGFGASIAMGISGAFGAYLTEHAVKKDEMAKFEEFMLESFDDTIVKDAAYVSSIFVAIVDGISPFIAAAISLIPFVFSLAFNLDIDLAYLFSFLTTSITLFTLGSYLGKMSRGNIIFYGLKMVLAGILVGILVLFVEIVSGG